MLGEIFLILVSNIFINNFILARFLGLCPFFGVSKKIETSLGMGMAVTFVATVSAAITWMIYNYVLLPLDLIYLKTIVFILVIATMVQVVEIILQKSSPVLYQSLGIFLPLITTNCMILGMALLVISKEYNLFYTAIYAFGASVGFTLALVILAGIREKLELALVPKPFRGSAIAFVTAGILAMAFMGFSGLVKG